MFSGVNRYTYVDRSIEAKFVCDGIKSYIFVPSIVAPTSLCMYNFPLALYLLFSSLNVNFGPHQASAMVTQTAPLSSICCQFCIIPPVAGSSTHISSSFGKTENEFPPRAG